MPGPTRVNTVGFCFGLDHEWKNAKEIMRQMIRAHMARATHRSQGRRILGAVCLERETLNMSQQSWEWFILMSLMSSK